MIPVTSLSFLTRALALVAVTAGPIAVAEGGPQVGGRADASDALDSDGDGLSDFDEVHKYRSDPRKADSDGDGVPDGDWLERREHTYTVRAVVQVMKPIAPAFLDGDFQDARVLDETDERVELEVLLYPFSTAAEALREDPDWRSAERDPELARWLEPGLTSDWDADLSARLRSELAADGIDVDTLSDRALVEQVSAWLLRRARYEDSFTTFFTAFDELGRPFVPDELMPHVAGGVPPTAEEWSRELSARGMFEHRTRGSCSSTAIYLSGCLRALGIPTRTVLGIPLFDAGDERQWELVREGIRHPAVRRAVLSGMRGLEGQWASHTFNEVWVGGRWWRLDYDELGAGILRPERFGLMIHVATFHDWADARMAEAVGRRQALRERDAVLRGTNPYALLSVRDELGARAQLELPAVERLAAQVTSLRWTDDPSLPADVREGIDRAGRFGLLAGLQGPASAVALRELLAVADLRMVLGADERPPISVALDAGCWWRLQEGHALVYLPFGPAQRGALALGVEYRPRFPNVSDEARFEAAPGLAVTRERELPPIASPSDAAHGEPAPVLRLSGTVLDAEGNPVRALVAAVWGEGSLSVRTDAGGRFELQPIVATEHVLHASTDDGRLALRGGVRPGSSVELEVQPASAITVDLAGRDRTRCAVFHGGARIVDFTLRAGSPVHVVVPAGELELRLYDSGAIHAERAVRLELGQHAGVDFSLPAGARR